MRVTDHLYGTVVVEDVLEELINSSLVQRLKGIYQGGASVLVNDTWNVRRYDHSIGVMLLIRRLGGRLEEQIAGLLRAVLDLLQSSHKESVHKWLDQLRQSVSVIEYPQDYDLHRKGKVRLIDSCFMSRGSLIRISAQSQNVKLMGQEAYEKAKKGVYVIIVNV